MSAICHESRFHLKLFHSFNFPIQLQLIFRYLISICSCLNKLYIQLIMTWNHYLRTDFLFQILFFDLYPSYICLGNFNNYFSKQINWNEFSIKPYQNSYYNLIYLQWKDAKETLTRFLLKNSWWSLNPNMTSTCTLHNR